MQKYKLIQEKNDFSKKEKVHFQIQSSEIKKGYLPKRKSKMQNQNCTFSKNKNNLLKKKTGTFVL